MAGEVNRTAELSSSEQIAQQVKQQAKEGASAQPQDPTAQPIPQEDTNSSEKIGFSAILFITINSIMGTGIFFLPAVGARESGLLSIISWAVMGLIAIYFSMIFAELVGIFPREGGVYEYAKEAFGRFPSFILGWMTLIAANVTIAMLIVGAITYIGPVLPKSALIAISLAFIFVFNFMAFKGLKTGTTMLLAFAIITLITVFGLMIPGLLQFNPANFTGWFAHDALSSGGFTGGLGAPLLVFLTIFFIAETFFGWETSTFLAEKVNNPKKVMPKVMIISTIAIAIIVFLFVIASLSIIPWETFGQSITPLSDLATAVYGSGATQIYSLLVYLAIIGSVAGWIVASPNLIVALAKDKLFITQLAKIHPTNRTPYKAIIFQTVFTSILVVIGAGSYETLLHMLVPLVLLLYASVVLSLIVIRKKYKHIERPYVAPGGNWGPWLLIVFTIALIVMWAATQHGALQTIGILFSFVLFGVPIYLLLFFHYDSNATIRFQNETAYLSFFFERIFFPKAVQKRLLANAVIKDNVVLELGASSGLVSKAIHNRMPRQQIIVEQPGPLHNLIRRRLKAGKGNHKVEYLEDKDIHTRIHPDINLVDEVFSFGILTNLHDEEMYLKQLATILPINSRIHFFDYVDMYKFIPNKEIVSDLPRLKAIFARAGFAVHIHKHKGTFWNYLIIDGIRTDDTEMVFI